MSLHCGRRPEHQERNHTNTERTCKLDLNPAPSWCEAPKYTQKGCSVYQETCAQCERVQTMSRRFCGVPRDDETTPASNYTVTPPEPSSPSADHF